MKKQWSLTPFESAPIQIIDGDRGKNYPNQNDYLSEGHCLFLNTGNVTQSGFSFDSVQFVSEGKDNELRKGKLNRGDVVMTTRGTIGNVAYYRDEIPFDHMRINSGMVILRCDKEKVSPSFLYCYLRSPLFVGQTRSMQSGVAQPQLPIRDINKIRIPIPPMAEQQRISEIISSYDDLIENNRRRIDLLEQSARLLYKEWFVTLRFPGHEHVKVNDGVPQGWEKTTVGNMSDFLSRGITPTYDDDAPGLVINQKCIRDGLLNLQLARHQKKEVPKDKLVRLGDVLVNSTGEGTLGRIAQVITNLENCTTDSHVTIVRPSHKIGQYYFGVALLGMESYLSTMGRGATNQTELSRATIADIEMLLPSASIALEFEVITKDLYSQISNLLNQNEKLQQARDLLLPRLMNGEIPV